MIMEADLVLTLLGLMINERSPKVASSISHPDGCSELLDLVLVGLDLVALKFAKGADVSKPFDALSWLSSRAVIPNCRKFPVTLALGLHKKSFTWLLYPSELDSREQNILGVKLCNHKTRMTSQERSPVGMRTPLGHHWAPPGHHYPHQPLPNSKLPAPQGPHPCPPPRHGNASSLAEDSRALRWRHLGSA